MLAPLLHADGATLYLVELGAAALHLHVGGKLSGSPGTPATIEHVIAPAVEAIAGKLKLIVSSGFLVPRGSELLTPVMPKPA